MKNRSILSALLVIAGLIFYFYEEHEPVVAVVRSQIAGRSLASQVVKSSEKNQRMKLKAKPSDRKIKFRERDIEATKAVYVRMLDYPSTTQPASDGSKIDPISKKMSPQQQHVLGDKKNINEISVQIPKSYFSSQDSEIAVTITTTTRGVPANSLVSLFLNEETYTAERESSGHYKVRVPIGDLAEGSYELVVKANFPDEEVTSELRFRKDQLIVQHIRQQDVHLDGSGDLVFTNQFEFFTPGHFLVEGTVYDERGVYLGKAHQLVRTSKGVQAISLKFFGYLFYQSKHSGIIKLKNIQINKVDENLITTGHYMRELNQASEAFSFDQFRSTSYDNELMKEKLSKLVE